MRTKWSNTMLAEPPGTLAARRQSGAYYTDLDAAHLMAERVARRAPVSVLEPSFGGGVFLHAIRDQLPNAELTGIEIAREPIADAVASGVLSSGSALQADFLSVKAFPVDAVIGNPPYVRLRHLPVEQVKAAQDATHRVLGGPMDPSGSLWMPFVLHATTFLRKGGQLALVLPWEMSHVRYARPLWSYLSGVFGSLEIVRIHERVFPDLLQDVVLLFADSFGGRTDSVRFQTFENLDDFRLGRARTEKAVGLNSILAGEGAFTKALLPTAAQVLLNEAGSLLADSSSVRERAVFNVGYVAGDKDYFHPTAELVKKFRLPERSLRAASTSARRLRGAGLRTGQLTCDQESRLFLPDAARLTKGEKDYLQWGESTGVSERYKCRVRSPWYIVPGVTVPDLLLTVFSSDPLLVINDRELVASNSLLCGRVLAGTPEDFVASWYTSLTRLELEVRVHALGGGVMILIPGEVGRVRIPNLRATTASLKQIDRSLRAGDISAAYSAGDARLFGRGCALGTGDLDCIREAIEELQHWRTR